MERKACSAAALITLFLQLSCWQFNYIGAFFGGAWCPHKTDKVVPCRVHNGTESYLGPNICWRNFNGTFACTKRMLTRPKFVTTYKRISETIYKCCPGLQGHSCQNECFNCSTFQAMQNRLGNLETKLNQIHVFPAGGDKAFGSGHRDIKNSIGDDDDEDLLGFLNIANDLKDLDTRLFQVETQLAKLIHSFDELVKPKFTERNVLPAEQKAQRHPEIVDSTEPISRATESFTITRSQRPGRLLEENLERGDIASTLNDDYGDEPVVSNPTEEYADQLYANASP
ncbi:unnamed protein product [Allacma fusca]|uniref:EMI domain-containing protein n=1 Tax=Allacma fusca TaxID=39272 RepID=A0A8J2PBY4_9HEXA|nr:unnamed protein product [Allacma fusca]